MRKTFRFGVAGIAPRGVASPLSNNSTSPKPFDPTRGRIVAGKTEQLTCKVAAAALNRRGERGRVCDERPAGKAANGQGVKKSPISTGKTLSMEDLKPVGKHAAALPPVCRKPYPFRGPRFADHTSVQKLRAVFEG